MKSRRLSLMILPIVLGLAADCLAADLHGEVYAQHALAAEPFPDERAMIQLSGPAGRFSSRTDSSGSYVFYGVPPGAYQLIVRSPYGDERRSVRVGTQGYQDLGSIIIRR